jgi:hypothetical protein
MEIMVEFELRVDALAILAIQNCQVVVSLPGRVHEVVVDEVHVLDSQDWKSRKKSEKERSA